MSERDQNIDVLLFSRSPQDAKGGMETVFSTMLHGLRERGFEVTPVYCAGDGAHSNRSCDGSASDEISLTELRTWHKIPRLRSLCNFLRSLLRVRRLVQNIRPDIVNCHYIDFYSVYFAILKPIFGYKLILTFHGSDVMRPGSLGQGVLPHLIRAADHVVGVSSKICRKVGEFTCVKDKNKVIYNGINFDFWSSTERYQGSSSTIVSVGSLVPLKGHDVLIEAFQRVQRFERNAELVIVGSGPLEDDLKAQVVSRELRDTVTFTGWLEKQEIRTLFEDASVFAFPSKSEGFGIALIEAMAAGLPCVATNVGGIPEVIRDHAVGTLVPPNDPESLAQGLLGILKDRECATRFSLNARLRANDFSWEKALVQYEQVYLEVYEN